VSIADQRISTSAQRHAPTPRVCSHVMGARLNVVVEAVACATDGDTAGPAAQIADRILDKVPR
jgi:PknH-like extracellular domain